MNSFLQELHIGYSIDDLNRFCDIKDFKCDSKRVESTVSSLFGNADSIASLDEEKAYIFYSQGLRIFERFHFDKEVNFSDKLKSDYDKAKRSMKRLHENLASRYSKSDPYALLNSLDICSDDIGPKSTNMNVDTKHFPGRWIPPDALYAILNTGKAIFFIDVRDSESFLQRKIRRPTQINLGDKSKLGSGSTVTSIAKNLNNVEIEYWKSRNNASLIVLIDEDSGKELIEYPDDAENFNLPTRHPLKIIYDALVTYNAEKNLLPPTVFLSGGISEFAKRYPTIMSLSPVPKKTSINSNTCISFAIDYPSLINEHLPPTDKPSDERIPHQHSPPKKPPVSYADLSKLISKELAKEQIIVKTFPEDVVTPKPPSETSATVFPRKDSKTYPPPQPTIDRSKKPLIIKSESASNLAPVVEKAGIPVIDRSKKPDDSHFSAKAPLSISSSSETLNKVQVKNGETISGLDNDDEKLPLEFEKTYTSRPLRRGIVNIGNSCYMNSILQALLHNSDLRRFFVTLDPVKISPKKTGISRYFAQLLRELNSGHSEPLKPSTFKIAMGELNSMFKGCSQQDSHEFLILLLDYLHEDLNIAKKLPSDLLRKSLYEPTLSENEPMHLAANSWARNRNSDDSEILNWFNGQLRSTVRCKDCGRKSFTFDEFMYLSLSVQNSHSNSLKSCINNFFKDEELVGSSRWMCPGCKKPRDAIKTFDIWRLPKHLIIHLKRFECFGACQKIESNVAFPLTELNLCNVAPRIPNSDCCYNLYAVINHYGTMESGHYIAFCYDDVDACWYKFDDSLVSRISSDNVQSSAAYILFYSNTKV